MGCETTWSMFRQHKWQTLVSHYPNHSLSHHCIFFLWYNKHDVRAWVIALETNRSNYISEIYHLQILCICNYLTLLNSSLGFPDSSVGKESACNAGGLSSIPELGRSTGEGIGYPLQYCWASLVVQLVKNPKNTGNSQNLVAKTPNNPIFKLARSLNRHFSKEWASLIAQLVKNLPAIWETWVLSLGWEDPLEKGKATHSSILAWRTAWTTAYGVTKSQTKLRDFHFISPNLVYLCRKC